MNRNIANGTRKLQIWCTAVALLFAAFGAQAQVQRTMINTGFEQPTITTSTTAGCIAIVSDTAVPGWITTDPSRGGLNTTTCQGTAIPGATGAGRPIEMWASGTSHTSGGPVTAREGNQFVELNAHTPSRLRQDVCLLSGETVGWQVSHRARVSATVADVMEFRIGSTPIARMSTANDGDPRSVTASLGTVNAPVLANSGWVDYSGTFSYTGASGTTDLGFEAISSVGGGATGNFLDRIQINLRPFVEFAQASYSPNENSPTGNRPQLIVAGTVPAGGMTVPVTISGGTATLGVDYTTTSGTNDVSVFIPAGVYDGTTFPLPITIINDGPGDPDETITFSTPATTAADPYNLSSLQTCGGAPLTSTTSTISENPAPLPRLQLSKALSASRVLGTDQFVMRIDGPNGLQTTTTGTGSAVANGTITVGPAQVGTAYTLSEAMSGGSGSPMSAYASSISCTNTTDNSATVLPSGTGTSFSLTLTATTDNISCVITNDVATAPTFIDVVKTVTSGQLYDSVGDTATFSYVVRNTGTTAVNTLTVTDNRIPTVTCPVTTLAAGASTTCTGTYTVTAADMDNVLVTNIATASARNPAGQVAIDTDDAVINRALPSMTADKATTATGYTTVGQVIPYTYTVTNTGNVTLSALSVTDNRIPVVSCPVTTLGAGASTTCTGNYTITQADLDAGSVTNVMTATATPAAGELGPVTDRVTITAPAAAPRLTLAKTAVSGNPYDAVGDVVNYQYVVTNTGNVTISALSVSDNRIATVTCPVTTLAPAASTTCTASYTITQADLNAGSVTNIATASGTPARGTLTPVTDNETVNAAANPALTLAKTAVSGDPYSTVGTVVNYQYLVTNTGNVSISALAVADDKIATVSCPVTTLAPAASTTCTASYTITQADLDAGSVTNHATATGTPAQGTLVPATANETVNATATPSLTLNKTAVSGNPYDAVGDVVAYQYVVANTGNVTINALSLSDDKIATVTCPVATLAPGASTTCTASYTITQADVDAGLVTNHATATGTPAQGTLTPATDNETVTSTATPALTLVKTAVAGNPYDAVGDVVSYEYLVTNISSITISALSVSDDKIATVTCPVTTLGAGASTTCTASYTITQADLDAESVTNIATATGTPATGTLVPDTDTETVVATVAPALTLVKTAMSGSPYDAVGDVIGYEYVVTNTGNITINALVVTDDRIPTVTCPVTTLAPGASTTCTASYTVLQSDLDAGSVTNIATATGSPPTLAPATDTEVVTGVMRPALTLDKTATAGNPYDRVGDVIEYEYVVTNTGNVTINALSVTDDKIAAVTCPVTVLVPGETTTCRATYTVVQADLFAGSVVNHATANGTPANGTLAPATDTETVMSQPSLVTYEKTVDTAGPVAAGDILVYTLSVTIVQGSTISPITLTDTLGAGLSLDSVRAAGDFTCNAASPLVCTLPAGIAPGTYSVTYAAVVGDTATGTVTNAVVGTSDPNDPNPPTCGVSCTTSTPVAAPTITIAKSSDPAPGSEVEVGDVIQYTLTATVQSSASLAAVVLVDTPDPGLTIGALPSGCAMTGATITCTLPAGTPVGSHTFTYPATVNARAGAAVGNSVTATSADGSQAPPICGTCSTSHQVAASELRLVKSVAVREVRIGDLVRYTLTVENIGPGNLTNGSIIDTPPAGFSYVADSLVVVDGDNHAQAEGFSPLRFTGVDIAGGQKATLTYLLRVGAGVRSGTHQNQAQAYSSSTGSPISNVATAEVQLVTDAMVDESLIFGTVFDDRDSDGWQDRADLSGLRVQGGFAPGAYVANSTTVDRGTGPQPEPDASSPLLHGIVVGDISARQSIADPVEHHQVVIRQRLKELAFTDDFALTSAQGVTVRMDAAGNTTVEKSGDAAKGLNAAEPKVERHVAQGEGGYVVDYVIGNMGIDERGIPGVRIASVEGLLIETDPFGRYHVAGVPGGPWERGRNYILKVYPSTLPTGTPFTTDNPLLRRITPGLPVRFDFGVKLPIEELQGEQKVELELGEVIFAPGSAEVRSEYLPVIEQIAGKVTEYRGGEVLISANGDTESLAFDRAVAVKAALLEKVPADIAGALKVSVRSNLDDPSSMVVGVTEGGPLLGTVLFDTDKSAVKPKFQPMLDKVADYLEKLGGGAIAIVGHTDPRASDAYNNALGMRRAKAVYEIIAAKLSPAVRAKVRVESNSDPAAPANTSK